LGHDDMTWRYVWAREAGTSHLEHGIPCQDDCAILTMAGSREPEVLVIAVADGAGSADEAERGSKLVVQTLLTCAQRSLAAGLRIEEIGQETAREWIATVVAAVEEQASLMGIPPRSLAATALLTLATARAVACVQVGDGVQVVRVKDQSYQVAIWPHQGEYASTTVFACDGDAIEAAEARVFTGPIADVVVMTDGMQPLAIHYATRSAHTPFFDMMLRSVRGADPGEHPELNRALGEFLLTEEVNQRTTDDKTLVIASLG
jgi:hypothetical protein